MSAPPDRPDRTPPQTSAIRVVPYSPPRPSGAPADDAQTSDLQTDDARDRRRGAQAPTKTGLAPSALPSSSARAAPTTLLGRRDGGVSHSAPATSHTGTSFADPKYSASPTVTPVPPSSNPSSLAAVNAPQRGRLSTTSYASQPSSQARRQSVSSHLSDAEPSPSSSAVSPGGPRRPSSRRSKFVAVLNEDKTFSLVPQRQRPEPEPQPQIPPPRSSSALSEYGGQGLRSSQLHSFATPRVSQASSHEGYSSYASSHYDRPSSSLTSTGTIPDRSLTPATPVPSSPGSSTVQESLIEDPVAESDPSWNSRSIGDSKGKRPAYSPGSDTTETPLPAVAESTPPGHGHDQPESHPEQGEQASIHSTTPSSASDRTNYLVYRTESEASPDIEQARTRQRQDQGDEGSDDNQLDPHVRAQASFDSAHTTSTEFETSNYKIYGHSDSEESEDAIPQLPVAGPSTGQEGHLHASSLEPQPSIGSIQSASTTSESTNYKVYGGSSPDLSPVPESGFQNPRALRPEPSFVSGASSSYDTANYRVYGRHSPAALSSVESFSPPSPSGSHRPLLESSAVAQPLYTQQEEEEEVGPSGNTEDPEPNYVVHGDPTPDQSRVPSPNRSPSGSIASEASAGSAGSGGTIVRHPPRIEHSQESLVIPPKSGKQRPQEKFGYYRSRSRSWNKDDLATKKSYKSLKSKGSSVSSIINEDAAEGFFAGQAYLDAPYDNTSPSVAGPSERQRQLDEQRERERQQRALSSWVESSESGQGSQGPMALPQTPHQWSSQLSTVMSESEPSSSGTRGSVGSMSPGGSGRRSSRGWSSHSRQMLSISSSLAGELENASRSRSDSNTDSLERPGPSYGNGRGGYHGLVRHHDEHGDGLADLQQISPRPSRTRLSEMFNHNNSSDRNLHSSSSSRSSRLNADGIPLWAKVYYGSGERRFLRSSSISSMSDVSSSRHMSMQYSASPVSDQFPQNIYTPRRRPKESGPDRHWRRHSAAGSLDIQPATPEGDNFVDVGFRSSLRRMTSSVWSPHLRRDVRAQNQYSIWDTPSVAWSADSGMFGRRNIQVVLFVVGFILPISWWIGAVLPLPKPSPLAMLERDASYSELGARPQSHEYDRHIETVDELRYSNARWWRMLNRVMSIIGLLIIGAVVGLVVAAVRQGWGTRT